MSECFADHRDPERIEHTVESLVKQRVMGLCLGYEDLNDHDELCRDRMMALLCESDDMKGERRHKESDRGKALAGKSTLNRMELTPAKEGDRRYKKIEADTAGLDALLVDVFLEAHEGDAPKEVVLDAGQPHIKSLSHQYVISEAIVQRCPDTLLPDADLRWLTLQKIKRHMSNHSHIMRRIASTNPTLVFPKRHVQSPVQLILDSPVRTYRLPK